MDDNLYGILDDRERPTAAAVGGWAGAEPAAPAAVDGSSPAASLGASPAASRPPYPASSRLPSPASSPNVTGV